MSIEKFEMIEKDPDANRNPEVDQNGEKCALIKVQTTEHNFLFDVGSLGITKVVSQNEQHPGEIWIYVPHGVKTLSLQHPLLGSINDYDLGQTLKKGKTYRLVLTSDRVNTQIIDYSNSQYIVLTVDPKEAEVYINGIKQHPNSLGICEIPLPFGTHNYRITSPLHYPEEGSFQINDKYNKHTLKIALKPAFGFLTFKGGDELNGGEVYSDGKYLGTMPIIRQPISHGSHEISIDKKLYLPFTGRVTIKDNEETIFSPVLTPHYASIDISVPEDKGAQIYDNGIYLGTGKWSGKIEVGKHSFETRKSNYNPTIKTIQLNSGENQVIHLDPPVPQYGSLYITSNPSDATVWMDNKKVGVTPYNNDKVVVGIHRIELTKNNFKSEIKNIHVAERQTAREHFRLSDYCTALISANKPSKVYINGKYVGNTPYKLYVIAGKYKINLVHDQDMIIMKTMNLNSSTKNIYMKLKRNLIRENEFYLQGGYMYTGTHCINFGIGGYYNKINIEGNFIWGLKDSEGVYWVEQDEYNSYGEKEYYRPIGFDIKTGYGFGFGKRTRLTPQLGYHFLKYWIRGDKSSSFSHINGPYASSISFGCRLHFSFTSWMGIALTPEYMLKIKGSTLYNALANISKNIKGFQTGFKANANLTFSF